MKHLVKHALLFSASLLLLSGCVKPVGRGGISMQPIVTQTPSSAAEAGGVTEPELKVSEQSVISYITPTPDAPRVLPTFSSDYYLYVVQYGDSLGYIASLYNMELETLLAANTLVDPDALEIGQIINVPARLTSTTASDFKIIPDSELVYGPASADFDIKEFVKSQNGYLASYRGYVGEDVMSGIQIVKRVSQEFSVNPRLLLALLEYQSGWVTNRHVDYLSVDYPMGNQDQKYQGLYMQLSWTANMLNRGYYLWKINALPYTPLDDGSIAPMSPLINAGTAAVQYMLGLNSNAADWQRAVGAGGVFHTYTQLFGIPFDRTIDPLLPADLAQPEMILPFEEYVVWSYTGGPHAGWGSGSAWAAIDFAPPGYEYGCYTSDAWVTAAADGVITRSENGVVVIDLDGDGFEQTGWTVLYLHIESRDRIAVGTQVEAGDRIGHASCEGGVSDGTHLHFARRYNGEWISADIGIPFILSGWTSAGYGDEYSGILTKNGVIVYSWNGRVRDNQIGR
jgi:murein DD-endopeptidase MepM/ murein hydrolase activator NlpD